MAVIERIRAVAYCRYSSSNQHETSIEGQMRSIEEFCKKQNWILVSSYQDRAVSGTTDNREQFQKMISDSYNHNFERVVVYKLDRFARNRYDSIIYKNKLKKNDVLLCSVNENLTDSPESVILESLLDGINEYYSKALSQIVIRGHLENAYKCVHNGGIPPLGYRVNSERKLEVVHEEAKIVKLIFELYTQGYGYSYILDRLNELNYHTKTGRTFSKSSLYEILSNPKYMGTFVYNRLASKDIDGKRNGHKNKPADKIICIEGGCDKIVSKAMFDKAQRIKAANKRNAGRYSSKEMYLLSGKVFCDCCGRKMTGNRSKCGRNKSLLVSYRCPSLKKICKNKEINATYLNSHVSVLIGQKLLNPKSLKKAVAKVNKYIEKYNTDYDSNYDTVSAQYSEILDNLANITAAVEKGLVTEDLVQRAENLEAEKTELEKRLCTMKLLEPVKYEDFEHLLRQYKEIKHNTEEYRMFIQQFVKEIRVRPYDFDIVLDMGLGVVADELTEKITMRREELYKLFDSHVRE